MTEILITSSVLILAVVILRAVFKSRISARLQYAVWLLVALRLLVPIEFGTSAISVTQLETERLDTAITQTAREPVAGPSYEEVYDRVSQEYASQGQDVSTPAVQHQIQIQTTQEIEFPTLGEIAGAVWVTGIAVMALWFLLVNLRLRRKLRKDASPVEVPDCPVPVMICPELNSPCLSGLLRPTVYLTPVCMEDPQRLKHILAHELTHLRHGDLFWSIIRSVCLCVYWFDPLVWAAAVLSKRDCELACDEGALAVLGEDQRLAYGTTLLDTVARTPSIHHLAETATSMNETKKQLTERVRFIVKKPKIYLTVTVCLILALCVAVGCTFTGSPDDPTEPTEATTEPTTATDETTGSPSNTWSMQAALVNNKGEVLETMELSAEVMVWDQDGREYYSLYFSYPEDIYNSASGVIPSPDDENAYNCCYGTGTEKGLEGKRAASFYIGFDLEYEAFIVDFDDGQDVYLIAYRSADADLSTLWTHFQDFIAMVQPATEPTEVEDPVINWAIPDYPTMSYDEYFSQTRYYYYTYSGAESWKKLSYWGGWHNGTDQCEVWHSDGKIFAGSSISGIYVQVGDTVYEDIDVVGCDEQWIYAIENHTELFRIDYYGENRQTLYVDESQKVATWDAFSVHPRDGCVLFFTAGYGDGFGIYRLYLPDMTLDLLYTTETRPFLYEPYSNFEITWSENADGTNDIFEIDYYYNCLSGELLERPVYGDRSWGNTTWAWWAETEEPPTEPVAADPEWLTDPVEYLPYDTFFREERPLHRIGLSYWNSGQSDTAYYHLDTDENGLYIYCLDNRSEREIVYRVPNSEWFRNSGRINLYYYVSDGRYVYCVRDENEIIRVELLTGEIESLYSGGEILQSFTVCKEGVLYFAARSQENWIFYRLYIPEQKLDVLYDQIPSEIPASSISFGIGETNFAPVEWKMMNPEFYPHLQAVLEDPNNQYVNEWWWMEELRDSDDYITYLGVESSALRLYWNIQEDCGIPYRLKCSYDYVNGIYEEEPEYAADPNAAE